MLGDLLCAVPALRALRARLSGRAPSRWSACRGPRALVERLSCVDDFIAFPGYPGLPERAVRRARAAGLPGERCRRGASISRCSCTAAARSSTRSWPPSAPATAPASATTRPWRPDDDAPLLRALAEARPRDPAPAGAHRPARPAARRHRARIPGAAPPTARRCAAIWPGVCDARRLRLRPRRRAAAVAALAGRALRRGRRRRLAERGETVVLTGTRRRGRAGRGAVGARCAYPAVNLAGRTTCGRSARWSRTRARVVCNDTGVSHIAAALGTPSVVVSSRQRRRALGAARPRSAIACCGSRCRCRPCSHVDCPIGHGCASAISVPKSRRRRRRACDATARRRRPQRQRPPQPRAGLDLMTRRLRILTWHVHGNYLYYLTQVPHDFYLATDAARSTHHSGRSGTLPWGDNVHEAPVETLQRHGVRRRRCSSRATSGTTTQHAMLSEAQRRLPRIYIEHDPPQAASDRHAPLGRRPERAAGPRDAVQRADVGQRAARRHASSSTASCRCRRRATAATSRAASSSSTTCSSRGRRLGARRLPAGRRARAARPRRHGQRRGRRRAARSPNDRLPGVMAAHRFFFNPIRYTSLGLAVIEAMMVGLPIVGLATTELVDGRSATARTASSTPASSRLVDAMQQLLEQPGLAARLGAAARRTAQRALRHRPLRRRLAGCAGAGRELAGPNASPRPLSCMTLVFPASTSAQRPSNTAPHRAQLNP